MCNQMQEPKTIAHANPGDRVIRIQELSEILGLSRSSIYNLMNPTSTSFDESFPRPIRLGKAAVGWRLSAVMAWIAARPEALPLR